MAVDMFLKLDGIQGEARDSLGHANEIDISTFSWGVSQSGNFNHGFGGAEGRANVQALNVTKKVDAASHALLKTCITGKHIPTGKLTIRKAGGGKPVEYVVINLEKVFVTSVSTSSSTGSETVMENIAFSFEKVNFVYQEQGDDGAKKGGTKEMSFNVTTNAAA